MRRHVIAPLLLFFMAPSLPAGVSSALDEYFTRLAAHGFSGSVLVARGEQVLLRKGYGFSDKKLGTLNGPDTAFNIASLDKQFIAAGILRLEELGKLETTDTLDRFFAGIPEDKKAITLHQVLTHTAGFPDEYWDQYETLTRAQFIAKILAEKPLTAPPGTRMSYASFDYWLLEEVIERASGVPFEQFLRREFWDPLGMNFTGAALPKWDPRNVARMTLWTIPAEALPGEARFADPVVRPAAWRVLVSTADDLYRWYLALRSGRVLTAESRKKYFTPALAHYAYGWNVVPTARGTTLIHHGGGGNFGSVVTFRWFVDEDVFVTILNNSPSVFSADYVMPDVEAIVFGGGGAMPPAATALDDAAAAAVTGRYRLPSGGTIDVVRPANGPLLAVTRDDDAIIALALGGVDGSKIVPDKMLEEKIVNWSRGKFERLGAFRDVKTMHYRTFVYEGSPEILSYSAVRFEKGVAVIRAILERDGTFALNLMRWPPGAELTLAPSPLGGYTTWDSRLGAVRIEFSTQEDTRGMRLTGDGGSVIAVRAASH